MAAPDSNLAKLLKKQKRKTISAEDLVKQTDPQKYVGATEAEGKKFLKRLAKDVDEDCANVEFAPSDDLSFATPKAKKSKVAQKLELSDPIADREKVSEYMKGVLKSQQPCPVAERIQAAAKEAAKRAAERDKAGELEEIAVLLDEVPRVRMVVGRVQAHDQRDKDRAPRPNARLIKGVDHRGHLFAANLAEVPELADVFINIIPEHGSVNVGAKKRFENAIADHIAQNPDAIVHTIHVPYYKGDDTRPFAVEHVVVIDGTPVGSVTLANPT